MKRFSSLTAAAALGLVMISTGPALAFDGQFTPPMLVPFPRTPLSSTLRILYRVAERFHESFAEGGWNFHAIPVVPGH
jgi:hypothetical protein